MLDVLFVQYCTVQWTKTLRVVGRQTRLTDMNREMQNGGRGTGRE